MKQATWILAVAMIALTSAAVAQTMGSARLVSQVPFEFVVDNHIVQPGQWTVQCATADGLTLAIRNSSAKLSLYSNFSRDDLAEVPRSSALVFKRYGNQYFLSEIRMEGSKVAYRLPETSAETELLAHKGPAAEKILLAFVK